MNNLEALKELTKEEDTIKLLGWLMDFAYWFDPGGWCDDESLNKYLMNDYLEDEDGK